MVAEKAKAIREQMEKLKKNQGIAIKTPGTPGTPPVKGGAPIPAAPVAIVNEEIQRKIEEARALLAQRKAAEEAEKVRLAKNELNDVQASS